MTRELWIAVGVLALFVLYGLVKVVAYMRQSERDWQKVDKSKLRRWEDDDEDGWHG